MQFEFPLSQAKYIWSSDYKIQPLLIRSYRLFPCRNGGDKTQLATVALAAQFNTVLPVWMGTTAGMMTADGIGIIIGIVLGKKIPERTVK